MTASLLAGCTGGERRDESPIAFDGCAHAHNDYEHDVPLLDALDHGFCSVEADIWLVGTASLLVAHDLGDVDPSRSLQSLYLDPLAAIVASDGGTVRGGSLVLLVDVKSDAVATWPVLEAALADHDSMFTRYAFGGLLAGPVLAVVSGSRDRAAMEAADMRHAFLDGRLEDLGDDTSELLMPLVSDDFAAAFDWSGHDSMPADQRDQMRSYVDAAHAEGKSIRFWGTPNLREVWREEAKAGVDLLNADNLDALQAFLSEETRAPE